MAQGRRAGHLARLLATALRSSAFLLTALLAGSIVAAPARAQQAPRAQNAPAPPASAQGTAAAAAPAAEAPVEIRAVQLRKEGERLEVHFVLSAPGEFEVVGNVAHRVVVIKFRNARPALSEERRDVAFNDPFLVGISFEQIGAGDTWAKLRLRTPALAYSVLPDAPPGRVVLGLSPAEPPQAVQLTGLRLAPFRGGTRLVLDVTGRTEVGEQRQGSTHLVRLRAVSPQLPLPVRAEDTRVAVDSVTRDGADTLVRIRLKQSQIQAQVQTAVAPFRVLLDYGPGQVAAGAAPLPGTAAPGALEAPAPQVREIPLDALLEQEPNPLLSANFVLAEREFRSGNFERANLLFLRVFDSKPTSLLGVRALFRAADAQYERNVAQNRRSFHDVIINYQSAIRSAEQIGYETELIPRTFFQIGRAYQRMGFHFESNVHYQILQERFPQNFPYAPDSYYYQGRNLQEMQQHEPATRSFVEFLARDGDPELAAPARYHLADSFFSLKRYVEAKTEFDKARRQTPDYADSRPLLLFHMGETYYENAEFDVARTIYRALLDRYPEKSYTKLVGLRLGDFLHEEGKEGEALAVYRLVIEKAPPEIRQRGKLRIANLLAGRPVGQDYKQALTLYEEVIKEGEGGAASQEARLRKALTHMRHGENQAALEALEALRREHPDGPFSRDNVVRAYIEENLKALVDRDFVNARYWEVAKLYTRYRDTYFPRFPFPYAVFQVGQAYQRLGLYDEAVGLYDEVLGAKPGPLSTLVRLQKALALYERDNLGAAEEQLLRFIQEHPQDVYTTDARMLLGRVYATGRRYEDALTAYRIVVQEFDRTQDPALGEVVSEVHFELGQVYKELGRNKEALDSFQAALATFHHPIQGANVPDFVILSQFHVGDMLYELGQDREALAAYEQAIGLYGEHDRAPWARYQMGLVYRRQGDDRKALDTFNTLVELAQRRPGELWESLARENQRDLAAKLDFRNYLRQ